MQNNTSVAPLFIIFSGYNQRAVIAFIRTLEEQKVDYVIIAKSDDDDIFLTSYAKKVLVTRKKKVLDLNYIRSVLCDVKNMKPTRRYFIAPSTEALNRFLLENKVVLGNDGFTVPLVDKGIYNEVSNKYSFGEMCQKQGIKTPGTLDTPQVSNIPFVAKPRSYYASDGLAYSPVIIETPEEYKKFFANIHTTDDFYFQEYVDGASYYLLFYVYKNGKVVVLTQKNYVQQPDGKSMIAAKIVEPIHDEIEKYKKLLSSIEYRGLIMIELKRSNNTRYYMIEANPRFWGPSQLFVDYGENLFTHMLMDWGIITAQNIEVGGGALYFWGGGVSSVGEQRLKYYEYSHKMLKTDWGKWLKADIYNRDDTRQLFEKGK